MIPSLRVYWCVAVTAVAGFGTWARSETVPALPFVSPIFGDNMVLQRDKPNRFWGWTTPGQQVTVRLGDATASATAGSDGRWQVQLNPPAAGGPYTVKIEGATTAELHNVLVGDVWICSGQSNMEFGLHSARDGEAEVAHADHPQIRLYTVKVHPVYGSAKVPEGKWRVCSPQNVMADSWQGFSAVAYFFAVRVQEQTHIPIGLIEDCIGGSPAESWISDETLQRLNLFDAQRKEIARLHEKGGVEYGNFIMHWYDEYDPGIKKPEWFSENFDDAGWKTVDLMHGFGPLEGAHEPAVLWLRREITLPDPLPAGKATLSLGVVEKMDTAYINGHFVGASSWVENPRLYRIDPTLLHPGKNQITLRVFKLQSANGFLSAPEKLNLSFENGPTIPLTGEWKGSLAVDARSPHPLPLGFENYPTMPTVLYRGMIEPVAPLAMTGALWYQGEANFTRAYQYRTLLPAMIADWRRVFQQGDFPFYIVSLPLFLPHRAQPGEDGWAELREAQWLTAKNVPNSGIAITVDTGDADNIHPKDKKIVGERLARTALALHYGEKIPYSGPVFEKAEATTGGIKVSFTHAETGLVIKGDKPAEFSIAGEDHKWHWAQARVEGNSILVSSPDVPKPVAVRYAWQANPVANVYNEAGLPAVPFRTDDWPESTQGK